MPGCSPLHVVQQRQGASFVEWNDWLWADHFGDPVGEHRAVRTDVGVWDISPLRMWEIRGVGVVPAVDAVFTNAVRTCPPGRIRYGALCDSSGAMINDATVYVHGTDRVWIITSRAVDGDHLAQRLGDVALHERGAIQLQGPRSRELLTSLSPAMPALEYFHFSLQTLDVAGVECWVSRIGYSGELGYELFCAPEEAEGLWRSLVDAGARPYGFAAVQTLRIEAGLPLLGAEFHSGRTCPYDVSLDNVVQLELDDFIGRDALARVAEMPPRRLVSLLLGGATVPAHGMCVSLSGRRVGTVTSACASPTLGGVIALAILDADAAGKGNRVKVGGVPAVVSSVPPYDPSKRRPRS